MKKNLLLVCAVAAMCGCASPERDLARARTENTPAAYLQVVNRHPNTPEAKTASNEAWALIKRDDSARVYQAYLTAAPNGECAQEAQQAVKERVVIPYLGFTGRRYGSEGGKLSDESMARAREMMKSDRGGYVDFFIRGTIGGVSMNGRGIPLKSNSFSNNTIETRDFGDLKCFMVGTPNILETGMTLVCGGTRQQRDAVLQYVQTASSLHP